MRIFRLLASFPQNFPLRYSAPFFLSLSLFVLSRYSHFHFGVKLKIPSSLLAGSCEKLLSMRSSLSLSSRRTLKNNKNTEKERMKFAKKRENTQTFSLISVKTFVLNGSKFARAPCYYDNFFSLCWMRSKI